MDMTKALKIDYISDNTEISELYYSLSRKARSQYDADLYANMALFKSNDIAKQETLKFHQKEFRSGTFTRDSGSVVSTISNRGSFGMDSVHSKKISSQDSDGSDNVSADMDAGSNFCSGYTYESDNSEKVAMLDMIERALERMVPDGLDKLLLAYQLTNSGYFTMGHDKIPEIFAKQIAILEPLARLKNGDIRTEALWRSLDYTRHEVRKSFTRIERIFSSLRD